MRTAGKVVLTAAVGLVAAGLFGWMGLNNAIRPLPPGDPLFVRFESGTTLDSALKTLSQKGVVRNPDASKLYLRLTGRTASVRRGTFEVAPGMGLSEVMKALQSPIRRMVRIPEGWWITRVAARLEKEQVAPAQEYIDLARKPSEFAGVVSFPLPKDSLEGYLYPDTYDLPPLLGARETIIQQLKAFEAKVVPAIRKDANLSRAVNIAAMVELEAGVDQERAKIAGVIENRIRKGMTLDIDATVLYAMGRWHNLGRGVVRRIKHPYNTYLNRGLPPGPIGSPSLKSIQAALAPAKHDWLFYVAKPDRFHLFAKTYPDHNRNIRIARAMWRQSEAAKKAAQESKK